MSLLTADRYRRALAFATRYAPPGASKIVGRPFWEDFVAIFDPELLRKTKFGVSVYKADGNERVLALVVPGQLLVEHRKAGRPLSRATTDHRHYFPHLALADRPRYVLVSDYAHFRLYDLHLDRDWSFALDELPLNLPLFAFLTNAPILPNAGYHPVNNEIVALLADLYAELAVYYRDRSVLHTLLLRLMCVWYADVTGLLGRNSLRALLETHTRPDGSDLGDWLMQCFRTLGQNATQRPADLPAVLQALPRLNGGLFRRLSPVFVFSAAARALLLRGTGLAWQHVGPTVLGLLFEDFFEAGTSRLLGPNTASRHNVRKVIRPLFLDELTQALATAGTNRAALEALHAHLASLRFFDPNCGGGTFLATAYHEVRLLEQAVITRLLAPQFGPGQYIDLTAYVRVQPSQLHGIDKSSQAVLLTETVLWLLDHQLNRRLAASFGVGFSSDPPRRTARIVIGNALTTDWALVCPPTEHLYLLGNPHTASAPRLGPAERLDLQAVAGPDLPHADVLDSAAGYHLKAAHLLRGTAGRTGFVHSQALMQGRQGQVLWGELLERQGFHLHFAHRNFQWSTRTETGPAVFCVVVGLGPQARPVRLFDYLSPISIPQEMPAVCLNSYLVGAGPLVLPHRIAPLSAVPPLQAGSRAHDGGYLMFSAAEKDVLEAQEPAAASLLRPYLGAEAYDTSNARWCLWLPGAAAPDPATLPLVAARVAQVARLRASRSGPAGGGAALPHQFAHNHQPATAYALLPRFMASRNAFFPVGFFPATTVVGHQCQVLPDATGYLFGVLASTMYTAWVRQVAERLRNDYLLTAGLAHHNFPFPPAPTPARRAAVEEAAAAVRAVRVYDLAIIPPALTQAHQQLDAAVDACYSPAPFLTTLGRLTFLFELYQTLAGPPPLA